MTHEPTDADLAPRPSASTADEAEPEAVGQGIAGPALGLCPFLATTSGSWRAAFPVRDHRCTAVTPAVPIAPGKQRRLCLTADHVTCSTYGAALELRGIAARSDADPVVRATGPHRPRRPIASTTPVLLERSRSFSPIPISMRSGAGQVALVGLLAIAFVVVLFAKIGGSAPGAASQSASPSVVASPSATPRPSPTPTPTPIATPAPSISPSGSPAPSATPRPTRTPRPSATPAPTFPPGTQTYTVKSGDTLSGIAAKFGTTVKAIADLNGLAPPYVIHPGEVLQIP